MSDLINNPEHYNTGSIECIEAIEASMTPEEFKGYLKGSVMKYLWRYQNKNNPAQDLEKCLWSCTERTNTRPPGPICATEVVSNRQNATFLELF